MANLVKVNTLAQDFAGKADFITIYTEEAHPSEYNHYRNYFVDIQKHRYGTSDQTLLVLVRNL